MKKNKKMNKRLMHFCEIASRNISRFAAENNTTATDFTFNKDIGHFESSMKLGNAEIHFIIDDAVLMGYKFLENSETELRPGLITRFKFNFSNFYFSPYDIHNALELSDFRTLDFHSILDDAMAEKAFSAVFDFISCNRFNIERIDSDSVLQQKLDENYKNDMRVVSKRITEDKLNKNFTKYAMKHENALCAHIEGADAMLGFVSRGKRKPLENYFLKKSRKNKLLTYEKRFYEYLMSHDFSMPENGVKEFVQKIKTDKKHSVMIQIISVVLAYVTIIALDMVICDSAQQALGNAHIICSVENAGLLWCFAVVALWFLYSLLIKKLFFRSSTAQPVLNFNSKAVSTVITIVCIAAVIAYGVSDYYMQQLTIALGDDSIIINYSPSEGEKIPYDSGRVEFFISDGWYDEDENTHYDEKELLIVIDGDYDNYIVSDVYDEELEQTLDELEAHNVNVTEFTDIDEFWDMYNIE